MVNTEPNRELMLEAEVQVAYKEFFTEDTKAAIQKNILKMLSASPDLDSEERDEILAEAIEAECSFAQKIIRAFVKWSKEEKPVVFWDIDDTLGKNPLGSQKFLDRSAIAGGKLFDFLKKLAPNAVHGLLTTRTREEIQAFVEQSSIGDRFDADMQYTTEVVDSSEVEKLSDAQELMVGAAKKVCILKGLIDSGVNAKWIDDFAGPEKVLGNSGVHVYDCMPKELTNVTEQ